MSYRSKLDAVLRLRDFKEEVAHQDFMKLKGLLVEQEDAYSVLRESLDIAAAGLAKKQGNGLDVTALDMHYNYFRKACTEASERQRAIQILSRGCEAQRKVLVEAVQERQVVETIETRRKGEYLREVNKKEQSVLDEVGGRQKRMTP